MTEAGRIRECILAMATDTNEGHVPSSFSIVEILLAIRNHQLRSGVFDPEKIVLSKGHASFGYYAFLAEQGLFSQTEIQSVCKTGSKFYGHLPHLDNDPRFHFGSGSLGHGLPYALGLSFGLSREEVPQTVYCIIGDGEANEGTFWESLLILEKFPELKIKIIIDHNQSSERAIPISRYLRGLAAVAPDDGFFASAPGHDVAELERCIESSCVILANTQKGFPLQEFSHPMWHHRSPKPAELDRFLKQLKGLSNES